MKPLSFLMLALLSCVAMGTVRAEDGETIFKSLGCTSCHKKEGSSKVNPSLTEIAQAYEGKETQLESYLKGESESIMRPEKAAMMKRQLEKTKALSDTDRRALAEYLLRRQQ